MIDPAAIRQATHLSQREFARVLGVNHSVVSRWESKQRHPSGPARALLALIASDPTGTMQILRERLSAQDDVDAA